MQRLISVAFAAALVADTAAWSVNPVPAGGLQHCATSQNAAVCRTSLLRLEEAAAAPAEAADDFTDDLLDALAADEAPLADEEEILDDTPLSEMISQPVFVRDENAEVTLEPRVSYTNEILVEEMKKKYQLHDKDTGSCQVQIAVLTARIGYMTTHMQQNKKDYASLRGLTAMVTRRRKLLEYLLKEDLSEFKRITSELGIRTTQLLKPKLAGARGRRVSA